MPRVLHLSRTPLNGHPVWLSYLQSRQGYESKICLVNHRENPRRPYPSDFKYTDQKGLRAFLAGCNVLHLHGDMTLEDQTVRQLVKTMPSNTIVVQQYYHDERRIPAVLRRKSQYGNEFPCVLAKKAAVLMPELPRLPVVVPHWMSELAPVYRNRERLRLVFTPTTEQKFLTYRGTSGKGFQETRPILARLEQIVDVEIITDLNWKETMRLKQEADIVLDELVTGGFGLASLEGLALGCIVVAGVGKRILEVLPKPFPFVHAKPETLFQAVRKLTTLSHEQRLKRMRAGREWIKTEYSEDFLSKAYDDFYRASFKKAYGNEDGMEREHRRGTPRIRPVNLGTISSIRRKAAERQKRGTLDARSSRLAGGPLAPGKKLVVQISKTNCAGAIWRIHDAINQYTEHDCRTITFSQQTNGRAYPVDVPWSRQDQVRTLMEQADVVHFHNWIHPDAAVMAPFKNIYKNKPVVIQYHTHPDQIRGALRLDPAKQPEWTTLVIAQKHARYYPNSIPVPNLMDPELEMLQPSGVPYGGGPLKLIFTPSDMKSYPDYRNICAGKGVPECMPVLEQLQKKGIIKLRVVTDMRWEELMPIKRRHHVCLDEVMTGGYHLCSLESLSQGLVTVARLDGTMQKMIHQIVGEKTTLPWLHTNHVRLKKALTDLYEAGPAHVEGMRKRSREWMVKYWHPRRMIQHYLQAYGFYPEVNKSGKAIVSTFRRRPLLDRYKVPAELHEDLLMLKGAWRGRQVVIWGNGPSARQAQRDKPWRDDAIHIGVNASFKMRDHFDAYCVGDVDFFNKPGMKEGVLAVEAVKVFQSHLKGSLPRNVGINYVSSISRDGFSSDMTRGVYYGLSIAYVALQLAAWGEASNVLMIGCEHDYSSGRFYSEPRKTDKRQRHTDAELPIIIQNYRDALELLKRLGLSVSTYGPSRLQSAGVPMTPLK